MNGNTIVLTVGQAKATLNGRGITLDAPAEIRGGRTFVPERFALRLIR